MDQFVVAAHHITADWLEAVLAPSHLLQGQHIQQVSVVEKQLNTGSGLSLQAVYDKKPEDLPERFFLKIGRRYSEVSFVQYLAPHMAQIPLVPCYHAVFHNEQGQSNLLFKDISETHAARSEVMPPSQTLLNRFVETLAAVHRIWWEHPGFNESPLKEQSDDLPGFVLMQVIPQFGHFVDTMGDALSSRRRAVYERILASLPLAAVTKRLDDHKAVTVAHGDAHFENFALPYAETDPLYLQDWALWHLNLPPYDLAYMLARTYPEFRQRIETPLIQHYHTCLGIPSYSLEACWDDYRMAMIYQTIWPIFFHSFVPAERWYRLFECTMTAFETLGCESVLS